MKKVIKGESLEDYLSSDVLAEWDTSKNVLKPYEVSKGSLTKTWWTCSYCDYEWETTARSRYHGSGCPICSRFKDGDITKTNPELLKDWAKENGNPRRFGKGSAEMLKWDCSECNYQWDATIPYKLSFEEKGYHCPYCEGNRIKTGFNDLETLYPNLSEEYDTTRNELPPNEILPKHSGKVWWVCKLGHSYEASVFQRAKQGRGCPYCAGKRVLVGFNDLESCFPKVVKEWDFTKNKIHPSGITKTNSDRVWWICKEGHSWKTSVAHRTSSKSKCPECQIEKSKEVTKENSFGDNFPKVLKRWDFKKNSISPFKIKVSYKEKVWWRGECGHSWKQTIKSRRKYNKEPCPYCSGQKALEGFNDLETLFPEMAKQWSDKNTLLPTEVTRGSDEKVWWECEKGHEWFVSVASRTFYNSSCPNCTYQSFTSQGEREVEEFIKEVLPEREVIANSRKVIPPFELDIYIPELSIAIEYNGLYWHSEEVLEDKNYHYNKWKLCKEKGIQLITVWEDEWQEKPELVKTMLKHKLNVSKQKKIFGRKTFVEEISYKTSSEFLDRTHIQGKTSGTHYLALKEKDTGEIVAVSVWRKHKNGFYLDRYATNHVVIGGLGKLLKHFQKLYPNSTIITFANHSVSDGEVYEKLGFKKDITIPPDYSYLVNGKREHKFNYRLKRFENDPNLHWEKNLTERELAEINGLEIIWDSGKTRYIF